MKVRGHLGGRLAGSALCALALIALALPTAAAAGDGAEASIIKGRGATIAEFPSLAFIEADEGKVGFSCTGTVVAPRVILTAAHCVGDLERGGFTPAVDYAVATGTTSPGEALSENVFRVVDTHVFPGFDPGNLRGDAGILVLDRPSAAPSIPLAGAADAASYAGGATVQLAGWGLTRANARRGAGSLRATPMVVQPPSSCKQRTRRNYPSFSPAGQLCTFDVPAGKSGGCYGDSGGPAIGQRADGSQVQLGVISTGGPFCDTKLPNVLTRADFVSTWVAEWIAAIETGAARPVVDPGAPFPLMTRPVAETFTIYTLQGSFGNRFEGAKQVGGRCRRVSRSRFRCEVSWRVGPTIYVGLVSPFYAQRPQGVTWDSSFRIEWAALACLRSDARRCPIHSKRG